MNSYNDDDDDDDEVILIIHCITGIGVDSMNCILYIVYNDNDDNDDDDDDDILMDTLSTALITTTYLTMSIQQ